MINIKKFTFNPVAVNTYLLWDETKEAVLIDPACFCPEEEEALDLFVDAQKLKIVQILNTHGHFDHLMGNNFAEGKWGLKCKIHSGDVPYVNQARQQAMLFGITMQNLFPTIELISECDEIHFGLSCLKVIHVPGHSPGSVAYYGESDKILIVGDILFSGSVGRTDLPGGNHNQLITGIKEKLLILGEDVKVYSGHGDDTTIGWEKRTNLFLQ